MLSAPNPPLVSPPTPIPPPKLLPSELVWPRDGRIACPPSTPRRCSPRRSVELREALTILTPLPGRRDAWPTSTFPRPSSFARRAARLCRTRPLSLPPALLSPGPRRWLTVRLEGPPREPLRSWQRLATQEPRRGPEPERQTSRDRPRSLPLLEPCAT